MLLRRSGAWLLRRWRTTAGPISAQPQPAVTAARPISIQRAPAVTAAARPISGADLLRRRRIALTAAAAAEANAAVFGDKLRIRAVRSCHTSSQQQESQPTQEPSPAAADSTPSQPDRLYKQLDIELRAHQPAVLKSYSWFAVTAAQELDIPVVESEAEPWPHKVRKTLLKSAFAHGKHRVQYEMRTYYHFLKLKNLTGSTADTYLEYVQRNLPEGVAMKVTRHELKPLPHEVAEDVRKSKLSGSEIESERNRD